MAAGTFTRVLVALGKALGDIADLFHDLESFQDTLQQLGWVATAVPQSYLDLATRADTLRTTVTTLPPQPTYDDLDQVVVGVQGLLTAIENLQDLPGGITDASFLTSLKQALVSQLVVEGTRRYLPAAYHLLAALGVITPASQTATSGRVASLREEVDLEKLQALVRQPVSYLKTYLGWGDDFLLGADVIEHLMGLVNALGGVSHLLNPGTLAAQQYGTLLDPQARGVLYLPLLRTANNLAETIFSVSLLPQAVAQEEYTPREVDEDGAFVDADPNLTRDNTDPDVLDAYVEVTDYQGDDPDGVDYLLGLTDHLTFNLAPNLPASQPLQLADNLTLSFPDLRNALTFTLTGTGVGFADATGPLATLSLDPALALEYAPAQPLIFIGEPGKTRLQADGVRLALALSVDRGAKLELKLVNSQLIIKGSEGDSFLSSVLPDSALAVPLSLTLSSLDGLRFNGANSLRLKSSPNRALGPVTFQQVTLGLESTADYDVALRAHADLLVKLGPVTVAASDVGASFTIKHLANPKDLHLGFDLPKGLGIEVKSDVVTGGGYLFLDPAHHTYKGVAHLAIKAGTTDINVNALGILQTELPDDPDGYSLLLLLTATFTPMQLGLGFTLSGLGGLLGLHRQADVDYLRGMVRQGQIRQLLFADSVMDDPTAALALADAAFPVAKGRYVIGLMARLGWGSVANLVTLDVALLVELPTPVRLLLLGVLEAVLPSPSNDRLKLRADFLGFVDFGAKKASFDASLSDSHILAFTLTGDLAFRLYQGDNPLFVITAGGFHPSFQPPAGAGLTGLRRLTLGLSRGDLQLALASYFAVTSNTVQFGAHLDLVYTIGHGFRAEGHFGFDVLFQFSPFRLLAHVEAGVAIKRGSTEYLSVYLSLDVTGPGPWHVWGEASFRVLFFKISFSVNTTIGSSPSEPALPAPNVHADLLAALRQPASWQVEAPATPALPGGVTLRPVTNTDGRVFLDPRGALSLRQRVAPLGVQLERYGTGPTAPTGGSYFEISEFKLGGDTYAPGAAQSSLEETRDFFAPAQFHNYSDAEKLSRPSFERLANGLRLRNLDALLGAPEATRRVVEYEKKLLSGASGGSLQSTSSRQAIGADTFRRLSRGSALGREVQQAQPSARAAQPVSWQDDTYEVVHADTLERYDTGHERFASYTEAAQYCRSLTTATPTLEVLVVPTYQLALA